jgi:hypothetical protein
MEFEESRKIQVEEIVKRLKERLPFDVLKKWVSLFQKRQEIDISDQKFANEYGKVGGFSRDTYNRYKRQFREVGVDVDMDKIEGDVCEVLERLKREGVEGKKRTKKRLTEEDKEQIFRKIVELEKDSYWRRRYIKQWHEGVLKIYKKRGKICWDSPPEIEVFIDAGKMHCFRYGDYDHPLTEEEKKRSREKPKLVEGAGKMVSLDDARQSGKV